MENNRPFIPGLSPPAPVSLGRYLPLLPQGMLAASFEGLVPPGAWIADPLGSTPSTALELARAGWKVLAACNNPLIAFMLEVMAGAPSQEDFTVALAELARLRRGDERLDTHLQSLYQTECSACGREIPAQYFLWDTDAVQPSARVFECRHCGESGEHPLAPSDLDRLNLAGNDHLHRARALERVGPWDDASREITAQVLALYRPRPLYFLFTLLNKIEVAPMAGNHRALLLALLLSAFDAGSSMWHTGGKGRPRHLTSPHPAREYNLWAAFESSARYWCASPAPVQLTRYPQLPAGQGGICLYPGRFRKLEDLTKVFPSPIAAAVFVMPRPNQAFWTFSAVWSGWLWGREALQPLKIGLERRRYDWNWFTPAMASTMGSVSQLLPGARAIGLIPELDPGFLASSLTAAASAGFRLDGLALREEEEIAQITWSCGPRSPSSGRHHEGQTIRRALQAHLEQSACPERYPRLSASAFLELERHGWLGAGPAAEPEKTLKKAQAALDGALDDHSLFRCFAPGQEAECGLWWHAAPPLAFELPVYDRVEMAFVDYLQNHPGCQLAEIDRELCRIFPGLLTPETGFIEALVESYAESYAAQPGRLQLHPREQPASRRADLGTARETLRSACANCGFTSDDGNPLLWYCSDGKAARAFYLMDSSIISRWVLAAAPLPPRQCVLVLPGSRSRLLAWKLRNDPRLEEVVGEGWRFLKLRHLRRLAGRGQASLETWESWLDEDPPLWEDSRQISIFG